MKIIDRRIDVKEKTNSDEIETHKNLVGFLKIGSDLFKYGI